MVKMFDRRSISKLSVALLVLLGVGAGMLHLKGYAFRPPSEAELRERVQSKNLLPVVKRVADRVRAGEHVGLQDPEGVQLAGNGVNKWWSLIQRDGGVQGVAFEFGGADRHYGIIVSEQAVKPAIGYQYLTPWGNDVWFYSEIPPRKE
jgi:hypothetical protein